MKVLSLVLVSSLVLFAGEMYGYGPARSNGVNAPTPVSASEQSESASSDFDETVGIDCSGCGDYCPNAWNGTCGNGFCCPPQYRCSASGTACFGLGLTE